MLRRGTLYKFNLFDHSAFYRIDYTYQNGTPAGRQPCLQLRLDAGAAGPSEVAVHAGWVYLSGWELSVFGNNLTKEESPLAISHGHPRCRTLLFIELPAALTLAL